MRTIVTTYHPDGTNEPPPHTKHCLARLTEMGYDYTIEVSRHNDAKICAIAFLNALDILEKYKGEDLLLVEDDCLMDIKKEDLEELIKFHQFPGIVRVVYAKIHNTGTSRWRTRFRTNLLCTGSQAIWIAGSYHEELIEKMKEAEPQHFDCFQSGYPGVRELQLTKSLGRQLQHYSRIIGRTRRGVRI
tara:strand:- start:159 stop:722 length:564 start_codon:yes stop_codon:yes gene_type:complete